MASANLKDISKNSKDLSYYRLLVLGQAGVGKSSVCNTILGKRKFLTTSNGETELYDVKTAREQRGEFDIEVIDGPSIAEPTRTETQYQQSRQNLEQNLLKLKQCLPEGFHLLIYVMKFGSRFTEEQVEATSLLKRYFGEDFFKKRCIIVLTYGDRFTDTMEEENTPKLSFHDWCLKQKGHFKTFIKECNRKIVLFNNRLHYDPVNEQTRKFFDVIKKMMPVQICLWPKLSRHTDSSPGTVDSFTAGCGDIQKETLDGNDNRKERCILVVGERGAGKSSVINAILGRRMSPKSSTSSEYQALVESVSLTNPPLDVSIIEGPNLVDDAIDDVEFTAALTAFGQGLEKVCDVWREGIDCLVYVMKFGINISEKQLQAHGYLKRVFGENIFSDKGIIVMSHGDICENTLGSMPEFSFRNWCTRQRTELADFIKESESRCILLNSRNSKGVQNFMLELHAIIANLPDLPRHKTDVTS